MNKMHVQTKKRVFVVTPTFNGIHDIPLFLSSFHKYTDGEIAQLVVVDNNSRDETVSYIEKNASAAHVIKNSENKGFVACNQGMRYAIEQGAEYVFLANQDLVFGEGWLKPLIEAMEQDTCIAAAQCKIMMYPDTDVINSCGNALHYLGFGYTLGYQKKESEYVRIIKNNQIREREYVNKIKLLEKTLKETEEMLKEIQIKFSMF